MTSTWTGVARVEDQIEQHLFQLRAIHDHAARLALEAGVQLDVLADHAPQQLFRLARDVRDVEQRRSHRLAAGKGEQL